MFIVLIQEWSRLGMTNANMVLCIVNVDKSKPENQNPIATPDEGEFIERRLVQFDQLLSQLQGKKGSLHDFQHL